MHIQHRNQDKTVIFVTNIGIARKVLRVTGKSRSREKSDKGSNF